MADAYEAGAGLPFTVRLVRALVAGDEAGGDRRGRQSAALKVWRAEPAGTPRRRDRRPPRRRRAAARAPAAGAAARLLARARNARRRGRGAAVGGAGGPPVRRARRAAGARSRRRSSSGPRSTTWSAACWPAGSTLSCSTWWSGASGPCSPKPRPHRPRPAGPAEPARVPVRLRRPARRHRDRIAGGLGAALPRPRARAAAREVGADGRHHRRLGHLGPPRGARGRAARPGGAEHAAGRARALAPRGRGAAAGNRRVPGGIRAPRDPPGDRLELLARLDRPASRRGSERDGGLGRDRHGRLRRLAREAEPTLYLEALDLLGVEAGEAVAFEDSPNGVRAATAAGIFTVGVPNAITRDLGLDAADLVLESLADLPPEQLLAGSRTAP